MWAQQESSVGSTYRVIAPDLRGHGDTPAPDGVYTMDAMAGDVLELLDDLRIHEPVVLGGLSMGGYVALALMALAPERFRALMLMDTRATADTPEAATNRELLASAVEATGRTEPVIDAMLPKLFSPHTGRNRPDRIEQVRAMMEKNPARGVVGALRGLAARPDRTAALAGIAVPTLVLVGAEDVITPPAESRAMAEALPDARLVVVPEAGHVAPLENPAASDAAILEFLAGLA
jgi:pimeloyl-ACP methyl ester carboxylesterase